MTAEERSLIRPSAFLSNAAVRILDRHAAKQSAFDMYRLLVGTPRNAISYRSRHTPTALFTKTDKHSAGPDKKI